MADDGCQSSNYDEVVLDVVEVQGAFLGGDDDVLERELLTAWMYMPARSITRGSRLHRVWLPVTTM